MYSGLENVLNQRQREILYTKRGITVCHKHKAKPARQVSAPLSMSPIEEAFAFEYTGEDFEVRNSIWLLDGLCHQEGFVKLYVLTM